jgi:hypothetical protein
MSSWPPTRQDLFRYGLPSVACSPDARTLDSITVTGPVLETRGHGFAGGESVRFVAPPGSTLPAGVNPAPLTWYVVQPTSDNDFFTVNGLSISDAGSGQIAVVEDYGPKLDDLMARRASWLVAWYKAGIGPWTVGPDWAPIIVAKLCALDVATTLRVASARYPIEDIRKSYDDAMKFLAELGKGEPFPDGVGPIDATPTIAESGAVHVQLRRGDFDLERRGDGERWGGDVA